jgi:hypothetical protein
MIFVLHLCDRAFEEAAIFSPGKDRQRGLPQLAGVVQLAVLQLSLAVQTEGAIGWAIAQGAIRFEE